MILRFPRLAGAVLLFAAQSLFAQQTKVPEEIDVGKSPRVYGSHFSRYGKTPAKVIRYENQFIRFVFPAGGKLTEADPHGLYSYFSLAGDFEVSAEFEIRTLTAPETGYGVSIGIALETTTPFGNVQITRGFMGDKPPVAGYIFTQAIPHESDTKYEVTMFPSTAKRGRMALKREKDELIFLAADKPADSLSELGRIKFTKEKITKMRFVADRGGDNNTFDNSIGSLKVRADEITGGLPKEELAEGPNWFRIACYVGLLGGIGFFIQRWRRRKRERDEE